MSDIKSVFTDLTSGVRYEIAGGGFAEDSSLTTAVIISLFTDRRAEAGDDTEEVRGWWADTLQEDEPIGSRRWTLSREKQTSDVLNALIAYDQEALAWLKKSGLVTKIAIDAEWIGQGLLSEAISLTLPNGQYQNYQVAETR